MTITKGKVTEIIIKVDDSFIEQAKIKGMESKYELIRCKDCRYSYEGCTKYVCERPFHEFTVEPDGYCAWAERRTDNG